MSTDKIISRVEGAVGHVIFNNPEKRNAVSLEMWQAVDGILDEFAGNPDIRVVVISGAGQLTVGNFLNVAAGGTLDAEAGALVTTAGTTKMTVSGALSGTVALTK